MIFSNPEIVQSMHDLAIGGVEVEGEEISLVSYLNLVKNRMIVLVANAVKERINENNDYSIALKSVVDDVYHYLHFSESTPEKADDEDDVVDIILKSHEYNRWHFTMYDRFMKTHVGVVNELTPIYAGGYNKVVEREDVSDMDFFDMIHSLCAVSTIIF